MIPTQALYHSREAIECSWAAQWLILPTTGMHKAMYDIRPREGHRLKNMDKNKLLCEPTPSDMEVLRGQMSKPNP